MAIGPYTGDIWATTNEVIGSSSVSLDGEGAEQSRFEQNDTFRQPEGPYEKTDIFFYVDRSLSMVNNLSNLSENFGVLLCSILSLDADYQIIVATEFGRRAQRRESSRPRPTIRRRCSATRPSTRRRAIPRREAGLPSRSLRWR